MRGWNHVIPLDPAADLPLFLQISRSIIDGIRQGQLTPGNRLPGTRALASALGVNRNTVLAAFDELRAEGWVTATNGGGTFVSHDLPIRVQPQFATHRAGLAAQAGYTLAPPLRSDPPPSFPPGTLWLAKGQPDLRLLPIHELTRSYRRALSHHGHSLLTFGDPRGHLRLRNALASMLETARGIAASAESILVTRGSQMALDLVARSLVNPGDAVAVESLGHPPAWSALKLAGARLLAVPVDEHGMDVDAFASMAERERIRAVLVTPHHQFPTTVVMPAARRLKLLDIARRHRIAVIEDDYDHEFHYSGRPLLPLASGDRSGTVIYVGTLSKILAPGFRMGFISAPAPVIERLASLRVALDLQGDLAMEYAIADLFESGELGRHVRRMRQIYQARRDTLVAAIRRNLGGALECDVPSGGMALWTRVSDDIDADAWAREALRHGVAIRGGRMYDLEDRYQPNFRLGFSYHDEHELTEAVHRLAVALKEIRRNVA
ncbi:MAG: PLP-dependent aminotransferase family protein [Gemmatimonadota bacterium]